MFSGLNLKHIFVASDDFLLSFSLDIKTGQCVEIKFSFRTVLFTFMTVKMTEKAHGNEALNRSNVFTCSERSHDKTLANGKRVTVHRNVAKKDYEHYFLL